MSAEKDAKHFSDGVIEEILNALDRIPALRMTPHTSSFSFNGKTVALDEIGRALRGASVIEGSVRQAGNEARITAKRLNAADSTRVWSEEFNRPMTPADMFAGQSEIAAKVAQKLGGAYVALTPSPVSTMPCRQKISPPPTPILRGRAGLTDVALDRATALARFEEALRLDLAYALAWADSARAWVFQRQRGAAHRTAENAPRARSAAAHALRLSPDLPEAHLALALVELSVDRDLEAAGRELDAIAPRRPRRPSVGTRGIGILPRTLGCRLDPAGGAGRRARSAKQPSPHAARERALCGRLVQRRGPPVGASKDRRANR